jgi:carbonic anhydrase
MLMREFNSCVKLFRCSWIYPFTSQSVLSYAVAALGVKHVIVMGHYGCGGVAAAIASPPKAQIDVATSAVQNWIEPIREIFRTSVRYAIM